MFRETILSYSNFDDILVSYKYSGEICVQLVLVLVIFSFRIYFC